MFDYLSYPSYVISHIINIGGDDLLELNANVSEFLCFCCLDRHVTDFVASVPFDSLAETFAFCRDSGEVSDMVYEYFLGGDDIEG